MTGLALDGMHIIGGGVARRLFECLFRIFSGARHGSNALQRLAKNALQDANRYLSEWTKPKEFVREVRGIDQMAHWKMREAHEALVYHLVALLAVPEIRSGVGEVPSDTAMCLVVALQLIYHSTHEKPSDYDIDEAETLLELFFENFKKEFKEGSVTPKIHSLLHLANECRIQGAHLGSFDSYPFENWIGEITKDLVRTGKNVPQQFVNNVTSNAANQLPLDSYGNATSHLVDSDAVVDEKLRLGSLELPSTTIERIDLRKHKVHCTGFECSTKLVEFSCDLSFNA